MNGNLHLPSRIPIQEKEMRLQVIDRQQLWTNIRTPRETEKVWIDQNSYGRRLDSLEPAWWERQELMEKG